MSDDVKVSIHDVDYEEPGDKGDSATFLARRADRGERGWPMWSQREEAPRRAKPAPRSRRAVS